MPISILGINHKTAPVAIREKVAFSPNDINQALVDLKSRTNVDEVAIVSTCNRMEVIYRHLSHNENSDIENDQAQIVNMESEVQLWLAEFHRLEPDDFRSHTYSHHKDDAVTHLMQVSCGLDSMVLGEPQILGQVKDAYGYAKNAGTLGLYLNQLFQQTFSVAKQVRTETQIGESAVSVAYAAVTLAKRIFADFSQVNALFIGAGETIELAARHLKRQGVVNINVANRTVERAQTLANEFAGLAHSLTSLPELVEKADIIISSTASPVPIIGKGLMEKVMFVRKHRAVFMVDLAVPRDIESQVGKISDVYLYTVDDMHGVIQENQKQRESAAKEAIGIINHHSQKYLTWLQSLSAVSLLKDYTQQCEILKNSEKERSLTKLESLGLNFADSDLVSLQNIIIELSNRLSQKMMHSPRLSIRSAGESKDNKALEILTEALCSDQKQKVNK
ncbi:MAG: glutamyl-tRNA reductase [Kangiellaceae bacterium]